MFSIVSNVIIFNINITLIPRLDLIVKKLKKVFILKKLKFNKNTLKTSVINTTKNKLMFNLARLFK